MLYERQYDLVDCLIMTSLFEGLPFVLVEAQAAGLPCVVSANVSRESNLSGLVQFVDFEAGEKVWVEKIILECKKERVDVAQKLIDQIFHWSAGDDHSVEVTVPYLVKGGIKGGQVVLVGVLGLVAGRAQQFHLDLYRRIGQLAQDLSFRHDLSGH